MRILYLLEPLAFGGVEKMVLYLCKYLGGQYDIHVAAPSHLLNNITSMYKNHAHLHSYTLSNPYNVFKATREIRRLIEKIRPDIIHTHARRPMVYTALVKNKATLLRTYHMQEYEKIPKTSFEYRLVERRVDAWAVTWKGIIESDLKHIDVDKVPIVVIPNGVPAVEVIKKNHEKLNLLFLGRLSHQKGLDIFIEALGLIKPGKLQRTNVMVVGEGEMEEQLKTRVRELRLESSVQFFGFQKNVHSFFSIADILIMPSRNEGLPLSLIEAMGAGVPVASTPVGAAIEIIQHGTNGWLVKSNTAEQWAAFINELLNNREQFDIEKIGAEALRTFERNYKVEVMVERYRNFYGSIHT